MNKPEFIAEVSLLTGATKVATKPMVEAVFDAITNALNAGETVEIAGFGKFVTVDRDAHTGRNPRTGEAVEVPAKKGVRFVPSNLLKGSVND